MSKENDEVLCWFGCFNVANWNVDKNAIDSIVSKYAPEEKNRILKFHFLIDSKRAAAAHLLTRYAISQTLFASPSSSNMQQVQFSRTPESKPFLTTVPAAPVHVDMNYSHSGDFVCMGMLLSSIHNAQQLRPVLGVDVEKMELRSSKNIDEFLDCFQSYFTKYEWSHNIYKGSFATSEQRHFALLHRFFVLWTLKEALIKATGWGFGLDLQRIEFHFSSDAALQAEKWDGLEPVLYLDGKLQKEWKFKVCQLDKHHMASIAVGELEDPLVIQSYQEAMRQQKVSETTPQQASLPAVKPMQQWLSRSDGLFETVDTWPAELS